MIKKTETEYLSRLSAAVGVISSYPRNVEELGKYLLNLNKNLREEDKIFNESINLLTDTLKKHDFDLVKSYQDLLSKKDMTSLRLGQILKWVSKN